MKKTPCGVCKAAGANSEHVAESGQLLIFLEIIIIINACFLQLHYLLCVLNAVFVQQEDGGLGITFVEGNTENGVEIQSISEVRGHTGKASLTSCS